MLYVMPHFKEKAMIKKLLLTIILTIPIFAISQNDTQLGITYIAYDWVQLKQKDQELIKKASEKYLAKLIKNDIKGFWEICHSKFKETTPFESFAENGKIIAEMISSIDSVEFIDAKKIVFSNAPKISQFSTGGSIDKSNPTYLQFYALPGIEDQSLSIYKVNSQPLSKMITMKFGFEDKEYKLTSFEINSCAIKNKNAKYYMDIADKWKVKESKLPQFIALTMAYRLSYLGKGTSTSRKLMLTEALQELIKDSMLISEVKKWVVNDSIYNVIQLEFLETRSDITPNIIYLSKVKLGEKSTKDEVKILFKYFMDKYPDLIEEFKIFAFTAYEEYPVIKTKQYRFYRVIMDSAKLQ